MIHVLDMWNHGVREYELDEPYLFNTWHISEGEI